MNHDDAIILDPPNTFIIKSVWMFISSDEGGEGIISVPSKFGNLPLIAADEARLKDLRPIAQDMTKLTNKKIKLIKLTTREDIEVLE